MNLIVLTAADFTTPGEAVITDSRRYQHITGIQGAQVGERMKVGLLNGSMGSGLIERITDNAIHLRCVLEQSPPASLPLTLLLGLPRPKMLKRIFQTVATLGVKQLYLINSYRVEKSYWQTPFLEPEAIAAQLLLGLEQGCDTLMPQVHLIRRFKPFVEDELPAIVAGSSALVAHPYTHNACPRNPGTPVTLAIGPEGGFIPYEIDLLSSCGFQPVTLGPRILKVETAVPYLISRLF